MAEVEVPLNTGLKSEGKRQKLAVLRSLAGADVLDAAEASEKLVQTNEGPVLVQSPARMGSELLRRQIKCVGTIPGPFSRSLLGKLSPEDLALLQEKAEDLDLAVAEDISRRGRDDPSGEGIV